MRGAGFLAPRVLCVFVCADALQRSHYSGGHELCMSLASVDRGGFESSLDFLSSRNFLHYQTGAGVSGVRAS